MSAADYPHVVYADGRWYVEGSKVPAKRIFDAHCNGIEFERLFKRYPTLGPAKVLTAVAFCYDNLDALK